MSEIDNELATFLNDEPAETEAAEPVAEEVTTEESTAEPETPETPEEEEGSPAEPEPEQEAKSDLVPIAGLLDEREKRQAAVKRAEELEARLNALESKPDEVPDVLEDQTGFVANIDARINQAVVNERANISEFHARKARADFDEAWPKVESFLVEKGLHSDVLNSVDPYGKAFELYDSHLETQALKDPDYREKMKAELKAEALAELKAEAEAEAKAAADKEALADSIPPSLAETRAAGGNTPPAQVIADPLDTTFNR